METRLGQKSGQLQLSSVNLAGSGLRPVTRSSAMAESTFDARVFLLGSGSTSLAWAGGAKPVDIGGLLAQPASKPAKPTSTQRKIAKRRITSTARSSMPQPPRFPPAMAAAPWPWPNLTHPKLAGKRKKHVLAVAHRGGAPRTSSTNARKKCRTLPAFTSDCQRNKFLARAGWKNRPSMPHLRVAASCAPPYHTPTQQRVKSETTHSHVFLVACLTLSPAFFICSTVFSLACLARSTIVWGGASGAGVAGAVAAAAGVAGAAGASREVDTSGCDR